MSQTIKKTILAILSAAMFIAPAYAQPTTPMSTPPPVDAPQEGDGGEWVSGRHINISNGCLKIWHCDCSKAKLPRHAQLKRIPPTDSAGLCKAGARGTCTSCEAPTPKKKCECKAEDR
ncbi:MAG: hypothetical protein HOC91_15770 [Nitrospinaceae bacterium]|jgi:hypothetical protein|nr:hypothetical protein [Nitrospinaceae bacterium]MBT5367509.1 hypothetical protein [Nitrospinaceae bacterium]MBT6393329.1 hypothetical protein [Nitrospinaceae bacterium]